MADFSTNDEISDIFNSYKMTKEVDKAKANPVENYEKIRLYNFRIPNRFTKDQLRSLKGIYENFATSLASHLSGILRKFCQVELISVEEHTFSEFNNAIVDPVLLAIIALEPLHGLSLMDISPFLAYGIIDRLLGGEGKFVNPIRGYTEIEVALMEKLTGQFLELMRESWSIFYEITPRLERIETRAQFAQIVPHNETIAIITFSVKMGEVEGMINYCVPHALVEPLFKDVKNKSDYYQSNIPKQDSKSSVILNKIENSKLDIMATFSDTSVNAKEVMNLQVGDVLLLDHKVKHPINLKINNRVKFKGFLGTKNNKCSVKISYSLTDDDD